MKRSLLVILCAAFFSPGNGVAEERASLVLRGGKVVTVDAKQPRASSIAVRGERIIAVGGDAEIAKLIGPETQVIELRGRLTIPGFIEGHGHFMSLGRAKMSLDLTKARNWGEIVELVATAAKKAQPGDWIIGRGWHQEKWNRKPTGHVEGYPHHASLSKLTPDNPVLLTHATGHMSFSNSRAMNLAGIDGDTPDPPGGRILRDTQGDATGALRETAQGSVSRAYSRALSRRTTAQREADAKEAFELATAECLAKGVTSFQDAGSSFATIDFYRQLADADKLKIRMWIMVRESNTRMRAKLADYRMVGYANGHLTVRGIKRMVDGALGSHGAWLLEPYVDQPESTGLNVESLDSIKETALLAIEHDYQLCVHAIGDRANREILDLFEFMFRSHPHKKDLRWRIEHAQHLHPADIPRFGQLGVIASMQANHATSDGPFVIDRLGEKRARGAYAWKSLLETGAIVTNGTDVPVEDVDPLGSFYSAVTRRMKNGETFFAGQCMTRAQALESYTLAAARAAFEEQDKGSLAAGKLADIVVLSRDLMTVPPDEIPQARVVYTIVGGRVVFRKSDPTGQ